MRFGRKSGSKDSEETEVELGHESAEAAATGPFDASEVDLDERDCVDLGSLLIAPVGSLELQLQVDEDSGQVMAVLLVGEDGALELRAFAASRGSDAWEELRPRISAEMARMGGTSDEQQGSFGTELLCMVPMAGTRRPGDHPAEPDRGPRRPGLAAAGHADGPAGRGARPRRSLGGDDPPGRRTTWA